MLIELFMKHGPKWSAFSRQIPGRTDDACSKRYREALDPNLKREEWTPEEDEMLIEAYNSIGGKWGQVGQSLQRSGLGCRNRSIKQYHYCLLSHSFPFKVASLGTQKGYDSPSNYLSSRVSSTSAPVTHSCLRASRK